DRLISDYYSLYRDHPNLRPYLAFERGRHRGLHLTGWECEAEHAALVAMVAKYEGEASGRITAHWLRKQPEGALVARDKEDEIIGFVFSAALDKADREDLAVDPALRAAWQYVEGLGGLRPGEEANLTRFWLAEDSYVAVTPGLAFLLRATLRRNISNPRTAFGFIVL